MVPYWNRPFRQPPCRVFYPYRFARECRGPHQKGSRFLFAVMGGLYQLPAIHFCSAVCWFEVWYVCGQMLAPSNANAHISRLSLSIVHRCSQASAHRGSSAAVGCARQPATLTKAAAAETARAASEYTALNLEGSFSQVPEDVRNVSLNHGGPIHRGRPLAGISDPGTEEPLDLSPPTERAESKEL